jgi:serine/threonine protein kinase
MNGPSDDPTLPLGRSERIDVLCLRFEHALTSTVATGERPQIEAYLESIAETDRTTLFRKLLMFEVEHLQAVSEEPSLEQYRARFPRDQAIVAEVFAELARNSTGAAERESPAPLVLGEYQLLEKLGQGGMGAVYKARHTKLQRMVALKLLPPRTADDRHAAGRFDYEMAALGRLKHPNIVQAFDARDVAGTRLLAMELIEGLDLSQLVHRCGPLPIADCCELIRQAALGLQCAHECGLVHRDVKPSNLMLATSGEVKILDLGLARLPDELLSDELTAVGHAMGSADYMSPEQASNSHGVDCRADIYSLGCTLYKLLSGRAPFSGPEYQSNLEKLIAHREKPVPPIASLRCDVPDGLMAMLDRMLAKSPEDRFARAADVASGIARFCDGSDLRGLLLRAGKSGPPDANSGAAPRPPARAPSAPADLASPALSTAPPPATDTARHELAARINIGRLGCGVMVTLATLGAVGVPMLYLELRSARDVRSSVAMVRPTPDSPRVALSPPAARAPVLLAPPAPVPALPPPAGAVQTREVWPNTPEPGLPFSSAPASPLARPGAATSMASPRDSVPPCDSATAMAEPRATWQATARQSLYLLQVELTLHDGSTSTRPFAAGCAVSERMLLTTGNVGCALFRFRARKFKVYAVAPDQGPRLEVTEFRVHRAYLDHRVDRAPSVGNDLALLTTAGRLPTVAPLATEVDLRWVEKGDRLTLLGYTHEAQRPGERLALRPVHAVVVRNSGQASANSHEARFLEVNVEPGLIGYAFGFAAFRSDGKLVGLYNHRVDQGEASGASRDFVTVVQPEIIKRGLSNADPGLWVEPTLRNDSTHGKP